MIVRLFFFGGKAIQFGLDRMYKRCLLNVNSLFFVTATPLNRRILVVSFSSEAAAFTYFFPIFSPQCTDAANLLFFKHRANSLKVTSDTQIRSPLCGKMCLL